MSNIDDLLISKMSSAERGKACSEIMQNNPGWSYDDSTKRTLRKLGWDESSSHTSSNSDFFENVFIPIIFYSFCFILFGGGTLIMFGIGYLIGDFVGGFIAAVITLWLIIKNWTA